jgi:ATP-binding cassette subfamily B protein
VAPLAFNLLMGRRWPPEPEDLGEAETICREMGLGRLLDAMPGALMQMVGETGWQLSNGEKSRVFLARALLQRAPAVLCVAHL